MFKLYFAEFIGTAVLILLGNGVVANVVLKDTKGNQSGWIVITTGWAFAVLTAVLITGHVSGAHLNPAVTVAMMINNTLPYLIGIYYIISQILGAILGAYFVWIFYKDHFDKTEDQDAIFACFATSPAINNPFRNILSEIIATCVFLLAIFGINHPNSGFSEIGGYFVACVVWGVGLSLGGTTGYAINPARDLGPRIAYTLLPIKNKKKDNWSYSWIPVCGPIIGSILAVFIYRIFN